MEKKALSSEKTATSLRKTELHWKKVIFTTSRPSSRRPNKDDLSKDDLHPANPSPGELVVAVELDGVDLPRGVELEGDLD